MNPVLRGEEDLSRDYLSDFHKEALNCRQTPNSISRDKTGNGEADSLQSLSTLEKKQQVSWQVIYFPLCHHLWIFPGTTPVFNGEGNSLCRVVTGLSPQRPRLNPRSVHVEIMAEKVEIGEVFSEIYGLVLLLPFHQRSIVIH